MAKKVHFVQHCLTKLSFLELEGLLIGTYSPMRFAKLDQIGPLCDVCFDMYDGAGAKLVKCCKPCG